MHRSAISGQVRCIALMSTYLGRALWLLDSVPAAAAEKVLKRNAELISSPSLPKHLKVALQGKSSSSEVRYRLIL